MGRKKIKDRACSHCKMDYPRTSEYYYRSNRKYPGDGFAYRCKKCCEESRRIYILKKKYNLSLDEYYNMMKKQDHKCAICGLHKRIEKDGKLVKYKTWHVDHDHETKKVRGLLCSNCNTAIGLLHDDIEVLEKAIKYLKGE